MYLSRGHIASTNTHNYLFLFYLGKITIAIAIAITVAIAINRSFIYRNLDLQLRSHYRP